MVQEQGYICPERLVTLYQTDQSIWKVWENENAGLTFNIFFFSNSFLNRHFYFWNENYQLCQL